MDEAQKSGNKSRVARLEKLLKGIDITKIAEESERMVNDFRNGLNKL